MEDTDEALHSYASCITIPQACMVVLEVGCVQQAEDQETTACQRMLARHVSQKSTLLSTCLAYACQLKHNGIDFPTSSCA